MVGMIAVLRLLGRKTAAGVMPFDELRSAMGDSRRAYGYTSITERLMSLGV
jgi:hypothetical protein